MSFCCSVTSASGTVRHLALENERPAIAEHRRGRDALEDGVDRDLARDAALLGERHRFAEAITSTISSRLTAIFIWQARPLPPMRVTFGPIASSTGLARSNAASSPPIITEALAGLHRDRAAGERASSMIEPALANSAATARLTSGSIVLMSM